MRMPVCTGRTFALPKGPITRYAMPSGWHILGRTPVRTFMPEREPAFLMAPGDEVVFATTDAARWDALDRAAEAGEPVAELLSA